MQRREITSGGGHVSGQLGWIHVGLGDADKAEVRVKWPGGDWSAAYEVIAGQFVILERGKPEPMVWTPR